MTEQTLSDDLLRACIDKYELRSKLRCNPDHDSEIGPDVYTFNTLSQLIRGLH